MKITARFLLALSAAFLTCATSSAQFRLNSCGQVSVGDNSESLQPDSLSTMRLFSTKVANAVNRIAFGAGSEMTIGQESENSQTLLLHGTHGVNMTSLDGYTFFRYSYSEPHYHTLYLNCDVNANSIYSLYEGSTATSTQGASALETLCDIAQTNNQSSAILASQPTSYMTMNADILETYYPGITKTDSAGVVYVNYQKLIPVLINAIIELKNQIGNMGLIVSPLSGQTTGGEMTSVNSKQAVVVDARLYQNAPNPFNAETHICYTIPESVTTATLYIYDMQGSQIRDYELRERGNGCVSISASDLDAGMYFYSLIADGVEIDTKRMILTK